MKWQNGAGPWWEHWSKGASKLRALSIWRLGQVGQEYLGPINLSCHHSDIDSNYKQIISRWLRFRFTDTLDCAGNIKETGPLIYWDRYFWFHGIHRWRISCHNSKESFRNAPLWWLYICSLSGLFSAAQREPSCHKGRSWS